LVAVNTTHTTQTKPTSTSQTTQTETKFNSQETSAASAGFVDDVDEDEFGDVEPDSAPDPDFDDEVIENPSPRKGFGVHSVLVKYCTS
jgi:hypothetical protein